MDSTKIDHITAIARRVPLVSIIFCFLLVEPRDDDAQPSSACKSNRVCQLRPLSEGFESLIMISLVYDMSPRYQRKKGEKDMSPRYML